MGDESYPLYVSDYGHGELAYQLPGIMTGTDAYLFAFPGDPATIQALVDGFLNTPAQGNVEYSLIGDVVFLAFLHVDRLWSKVAPMGWTTDHECGIWIPLLARGGGAGDRIVIWMPYIFIDWQEGMITGREVLGYRKSMGKVEMPVTHDDGARFAVTTTVFPTFNQQTQQVSETIITVQRDGSVGSLASEWKEGTHALKALLAVWTKELGQLHAHRFEIAIDVAKLLLEMEIPIVNLKQFRAAHDSTRACYQAIVECGIGIHGFHGGGILAGDFDLDIVKVASHRIAADLGLTVPVKAEFAAWLKLDLSADGGREVWKA